MAESLIWGDSWLLLPLEDFAFPPKAARNCLVDSDLSVKVSDFGMTRWASDVPKQLFLLQCCHLGGRGRRSGDHETLSQEERNRANKKLARKLKRSADYGCSMSFVGLADGGRPWRQCWPIKVFPLYVLMSVLMFSLQIRSWWPVCQFSRNQVSSQVVGPRGVSLLQIQQQVRRMGVR